MHSLRGKSRVLEAQESRFTLFTDKLWRFQAFSFLWSLLPIYYDYFYEEAFIKVMKPIVSILGADNANRADSVDSWSQTNIDEILYHVFTYTNN